MSSTAGGSLKQGLLTRQLSAALPAAAVAPQNVPADIAQAQPTSGGPAVILEGSAEQHAGGVLACSSECLPDSQAALPACRAAKAGARALESPGTNTGPLCR